MLFVRSLSELHVLSQTTYIIKTDMAVSSADFTAFFQDDVQKYVESCSYFRAELVGSVVRGKCYDVSYTTGVVVFITTYLHKLIHQRSFKSMNIICVIQGTNQTGSKNNFPFPVDYCSDFFHTKVTWGPPEGDLGTLSHLLCTTAQKIPE